MKIYQNKPQTIKHEDFTSEVLENIQVKMYHLYQSKPSSVCFPHKIIASKSIDVPFHVLIKKDEEYCNDFFFQILNWKMFYKICKLSTESSFLKHSIYMYLIHSKVCISAIKSQISIFRKMHVFMVWKI